jgi:hypothetical protein
MTAPENPARFCFLAIGGIVKEQFGNNPLLYCMDKKIIFSNHAIVRMEERFVSRQIAIDAIENPDKIEKSFQEDCRILVKKVYFNKSLKRDHLLIIVCEISLDKIEVITIIDTSKISKYL